MEKTKKIIAWISRHPPLPAQIRRLKNIFGNVVTVQFAKTFSSAEEIIKQLKDMHINIAVIVAPLSMIEKMTHEKDILWLWAEMQAIHECTEQCNTFNPDCDVILTMDKNSRRRHMRFIDFKKIVEVKIVTEEIKDNGVI